MTRKLLTLIAAFAVMALFASASLAAVTFDSATGTGFVGKGDVQTVLGINNKAMQTIQDKVTFGYDDTTTYTFTCTWQTGQEDKRKTHTNNKEISSGVAAELNSKGRLTGQYTGWFLEGYKTTADSSDSGYPTDADCGAEGNDMKSIVPGSIEEIGSTGGGLYFKYNDVKYPLAITPVL